nr:hypothetical protein [Tanacetum cinerariifolium]
KGKSKVDEGRSSRDSFAENGMASEKMNIDERVINKKKYGGVENVNIGIRIYEGEDDEVCAEAYDNMVSQIRMGNSEDINDKVAEDRSGIAQFLTQDVVFNVGNCELNQDQDTSVPPLII